MIAYFIIWILSMAVMAMPVAEAKGYNIKLIICFSILFVFGGFRYDFGLDYTAYESYFNYVKSMSTFLHDSNERMEIGYSFLNFICPNYRVLIILTSALVCIAYYSLFKRYIPEKFGLLAIFLLYLSGNNTVFFMFSGIRNAIAISLLILSIPLIINRKLLYFSAVTVLAWSMHNSALIIFPTAYIIGYVKEIDRGVAKWMTIVAIALFIIPFDALIGFSTGFVLANFDRYATYIEAAGDIGKGSSILVALSNVLIISLTGYSLSKIKIGKSASIIVLLGLMACYFPLLGPLDLRLSIYFGGILVVGIVIAYSKIRDRLNRGIILGILFAYKAYAFFIVWLNNPYFAYDNIHNYFLDYIINL